MPITKTAEKELRVAERRQVRNKGVRTVCKTAVKKTEKLLFSGDIKSAKEAAVTAASTLDKAAKKGVIHANKAARTKSRMMKKLNKAEKIVAEPKTEKKSK